MDREIETGDGGCTMKERGGCGWVGVGRGGRRGGGGEVGTTKEFSNNNNNR